MSTSAYLLSNGLKTEINLACKRIYCMKRASNLFRDKEKCTAVSRIGEMRMQLSSVGMDSFTAFDGACTNIQKGVINLDLREPATEKNPASCDCQCCTLDFKKTLIN